MNYTLMKVAESLASYLATWFPGVKFYEDPNQQGTTCPCMFLQCRSSKIENRCGDRWLNTLKLDLTYLEDYNLPDLQERYNSAAARMDEHMETFPYWMDGLVRTYNREWTIDLDALHYKFELRLWLYHDDAAGEKMQTLDLSEEVTS